MVSNEVYQNYIGILKEEMIPAMGCTEPIAPGIWSCQSP